MIWDVEIVCDQPILADFADGLYGEGVVVASGASHKLNPTLFDSTASYDEAMAIAGRAVDEINGFLKVFLRSRAKVSVGRVSREEPGEPRVHYISVMDSVSLWSSVFGGTLGSGVDASPAGAAVVLQLPDYRNSFAAWQAFVREHRAAEDVLKYLAGSLSDWTNLWRLVEVVEHDVGGERALLDLGWVDAERYKLFKRTANDPAVAGPTARHGARKNMPTPGPMDISEARSLTLEILRRRVAAFGDDGASSWVDPRGE